MESRHLLHVKKIPVTLSQVVPTWVPLWYLLSWRSSRQPGWRVWRLGGRHPHRRRRPPRRGSWRRRACRGWPRARRPTPAGLARRRSCRGCEPCAGPRRTPCGSAGTVLGRSSETGTGKWLVKMFYITVVSENMGQ